MSVDIEALLATVREGRDPGHPTVFDEALDALAAELERLRRDVNEHVAAVQHASDLQDEAEAELERVKREATEYAYELDDKRIAAEAEVERVKAERDEALARIPIAEFLTGERAEARLDKALAALREIATTVTYDDTQGKIARAAIAEIEGETT